MTPADLSLTVLRAVRRAVGDGVLRAVEVPRRVVVERPRPGGCGDWATNAALQLAGPAALPPRRVAEVLRERLLDAPGIERVDITGPGFLNLTLRADTRAEGDQLLVERVLAEKGRYGHGEALRHLDAALVSFPPPGEPRLAVLTDTVVTLLRSQGAPARVTTDGAQELHALPAHYDVHAALGPDAARWALLRPAPHDRVLDAEPLLRQSEAVNSLFTVQYAHSRARALLRNAAALGVDSAYEVPVDAAVLTGALVDHASVLLGAARHRAPDRLARHLEATADALLGFQHTVLPRGDEKPTAAHRSRLALAEAAGTVLAGGLSLLGISAPDHL
ncbi:ArgS-related anticodon-binding protein NrtL [Streptomyces sp. TRM49041]|uniref:ArgS-related anticodon-binding protein NrtL n=1 Tax=Streptomyces sp. TRM49041 TaxID=2603216 RepID=UPI0011EBB124|nr:arginine--tRNA ligase [Streptomyces sp. TRM49041]